MSGSKYISVGVVVKPHGLKGSITVKVEANYALQFPEFRSVFADHGGAFVPYVIESFAALNKGMVKLQFSGVKDQATANALRGEVLYQSADLLSIEKQVDLVGFTLVDQSAGNVGDVTSVIESTAQTMLEIDRNGEEVYIPFVEEFLLDVDQKERKIYMDLPDGMLDL